MQKADAEDVTQDVLLKLSKRMERFSYDPTKSFRAWLKTITRHAWIDLQMSRKVGTAGTGDSVALQVLTNVEAREDLAARLEEEFDKELLDEATLRVQLRVSPEKWQVFQLLAFDGLSGEEVAKRCNMKIATVYVVRSKVQRMLQDEIQALETASIPTAGAGP